MRKATLPNFEFKIMRWENNTDSSFPTICMCIWIRSHSDRWFRVALQWVVNLQFSKPYQYAKCDFSAAPNGTHDAKSICPCYIVQCTCMRYHPKRMPIRNFTLCYRIAEIACTLLEHWGCLSVCLYSIRSVLQIKWKYCWLSEWVSEYAYMEWSCSSVIALVVSMRRFNIFVTHFIEGKTKTDTLAWCAICVLSKNTCCM